MTLVLARASNDKNEIYVAADSIVIWPRGPQLAETTMIGQHRLKTKILTLSPSIVMGVSAGLDEWSSLYDDYLWHGQQTLSLHETGQRVTTSMQQHFRWENEGHALIIGFNGDEEPDCLKLDKFPNKANPVQPEPNGTVLRDSGISIGCRGIGAAPTETDVIRSVKQIVNESRQIHWRGKPVFDSNGHPVPDVLAPVYGGTLRPDGWTPYI